jgi:hypothetical protein
VVPATAVNGTAVIWNGGDEHAMPTAAITTTAVI